MNLKMIMRFLDSLFYVLGVMKWSRNLLNLRVIWNGLKVFMKKVMVLF